MAAMRPPRIPISIRPSRPCPGSRTCPPLITTSYGMNRHLPLGCCEQLAACQASTLGHRLELRPGDLGMPVARAQTAVRTSDHVLGPDESRVAYQAVSDQARVLA